MGIFTHSPFLKIVWEIKHIKQDSISTTEIYKCNKVESYELKSTYQIIKNWQNYLEFYNLSPNKAWEILYSKLISFINLGIKNIIDK